MNLRMQRLCVWCGPGLILIFMIGFLFVAGLVPPPSPNLGASEVARFYTEHQTRIQIGLIISMIGSGLAFPWAAVISVQMRRIEGRRSPLAATQLTAGGVLCLLLVFPMFALSAAAYRPADRSPEITQALNDLGWLPLVGFVAPPVVQVIAIALAVFSDKSAEPVFPRWVGYFSLWCAVLLTPGILVIVFHTGPFAWNGIFAFWLPLTVLGTWFFVMTVPLLQAIKQQEREQESRQSAALAPPSPAGT